MQHQKVCESIGLVKVDLSRQKNIKFKRRHMTKIKKI